MGKTDDIPDLKWAAAISKEFGSPVRCPFATVETCPRYYQSLSLMGSAGSTKIPEAEDNRLKEKWAKSDLWPRADEQASAIFGSKEKISIFSRICPEVMFDRFGYFASGLTRYADEIDVEFAHEQLGREGASREDPRWSWSSCTPLHYTECSIYAVLQNRKEREIPGQDDSITAQDPAGMTKAYTCPTCKVDTTHAILAIVNRQDWSDDGSIHFWHHYLTIKCAGCGTVSFCHESMNSEEEDFDSQGRPFRIKTRKNYPEAAAPQELFVNPHRIKEIQELTKVKYDTAKLSSLLLELNRAYATGSYLSCIFLLRAVLDHVPPIFGCSTFQEVANNYSGCGKSFKDAMQHLQNSVRKIADSYLHMPIRASESLPNREQVEFRSPIDLMLGEIVRTMRAP